MKITVSQLRKIIKEEIQRNFLKEVLDASLAPNPKTNLEVSAQRNEWFDGFRKSLIEQIKENITSQFGKEISYNIRFQNSKDQISLVFDDDKFLSQVQRYLKDGYKGSNEFIDELVSSGNPEDLKASLPELSSQMLETVKKTIKGLGFSNSGDGFTASLTNDTEYRINLYPASMPGEQVFIKIQVSLGK
jgi:hypothetical protein